jgi:tetrahydromethanopterin S-methyltransferase subunit G
MQAALVAACVGIAWAAAGAMFSDHSAKVMPLQTASLPVASVEPRHAAVAPENSETRRLSEDIRALKKELDGLRSSMAQNPAPEELRAIKKSVDSLKGGLEGTKAEMASSLAQLSSKLDKAQHDPAKLREISDRLDHMERAAPLTTASIAPPQESPAKPATVPLPPAKAQSLSAIPAPAAKPAQTAVAMTSPTGEKPQLIANWVVRDVYDGIALVEGPHGSVEVIEGETIPGAGTVKSIERRGSGWIVLTSRGLVDSARN